MSHRSNGTESYSVETSFHRLRSEFAALRFQLALRRLALELKYNFNPNQPRVPKGSPQSGEWTDGHRGPSGGATRAPTRPRTTSPKPAAASRRPSLGGPLSQGAQMLREADAAREAAAVNAALEKFGLNPSSPADVAAARAYVWGKQIAPMNYWDVPFSGAANEAVAEALMRHERKYPGTLDRAANGDKQSKLALDEVVKDALTGGPQKPDGGPPNPIRVVPGSGVETRTDEERDLVASLRGQGASPAQIANEIANLRAQRKRARNRDVAATRRARPIPPARVLDLPPNSPPGTKRYAVGRNEITLRPSTISKKSYNAEFVVREDFGDLRRPPEVINAQNEARRRGRPDDHGFHILPHRLFPGLPEPIEPGNKVLNSSAWRSMEEQIARTATRGLEVRGSITLNPGYGERPASFTVEYSTYRADGSEESYFHRTVPNEAPEK